MCIRDRIWITVFAGDHGVVAEGVSAFPQAVTAEMVRNFARGGAAISVLAREWNARLEVVNVGTARALPELSGVLDARVGPGTANFVEGPAMTSEQLGAALAAGHDAAERAAIGGAQLFIGGEMGIGNTTSAAAVACSLLELPAERLAGPGTGLDLSLIHICSRVRLSWDSASTGTDSSLASDFRAREISDTSVARFSLVPGTCINWR